MKQTPTKLVNVLTIALLVLHAAGCGGSRPDGRDPDDVEEEEEEKAEQAEERQKEALRKKIGIGKAPPHDNCKELGNIDGTGGGGGWTTSEMKMRDAQDELRAKADKLGGNYVVMDATGGDLSGITITGRAYACGEGTSGGGTAAPATDTKSPAERLEQLKALHDKGLITDAEYDKQRQEILQSL
jgi:hypothetical protein